MSDINLYECSLLKITTIKLSRLWPREKKYCKCRLVNLCFVFIREKKITCVNTVSINFFSSLKIFAPLKLMFCGPQCFRGLRKFFLIKISEEFMFRPVVSREDYSSPAVAGPYFLAFSIECRSPIIYFGIVKIFLVFFIVYFFFQSVECRTYYDYKIGKRAKFRTRASFNFCTFYSRLAVAFFFFLHQTFRVNNILIMFGTTFTSNLTF